MTRLAAILTLLCARDDGPSLAAGPWTGFKEGSWVRTKAVSKGDGEVVFSCEMKQTVKSIGKDDLLIETETRKGDQPAEKTEDKVPLKDKAEFKSLGQEELKCAGRTFLCDVREYARGEITARVWICKDAGVPSRILRIEEKRPARMDTILKQLVSLSEKLTIAGREVECCVYEYERTGGGLNMTGREWESAGVPGLVVRSARKGTFSGSGPEKLESTLEVLDFEVK